MLKFISFGSGSSGNCYYLATATDALLIDSGLGIRLLKKHFKEYGVTLASVHNILITHDHADHIKSVGYMSNDYNLPVYTTKYVHDGIKRNYCVSKKIPAEHIHYIEKAAKLQEGANKNKKICKMTKNGRIFLIKSQKTLDKQRKK